MRKLVVFILAAAILLSACGDVPVEITKSDPNKVSEPVEIRFEIESRAGDPEANLLADPMFDTDEYLEDYDADLGFLINGDNTFVGFCETEDSYYYISRSDNCPILTFVDKKTLTQFPLCPKPECTHDNADCGAYIMTFSAPKIYCGRIWWASWCGDSELDVYSCSLDGADRRLEFKTDALKAGKDIKTNEANYNAIFHRGYLYVSYTRSAVENAVPTSHIFVSRVPLSGDGKSEEVLSLTSNSDYGDVRVIPHANDIYIALNAYNYLGRQEADAVVKFDSETGGLDVLFNISGNYDDIPVKVSNLGVSPDGELYFSKRGKVLRFEPEIGEFETVYDNGDEYDRGKYDEARFGRDVMWFPGVAKAGEGSVGYMIMDYDLNVIHKGEFDILEDIDLTDFESEPEWSMCSPVAIGRSETLWQVLFGGESVNNPMMSWSEYLYIGVAFDGGVKQYGGVHYGT